MSALHASEGLFLGQLSLRSQPSMKRCNGKPAPRKSTTVLGDCGSSLAMRIEERLTPTSVARPHLNPAYISGTHFLQFGQTPCTIRKGQHVSCLGYSCLLGQEDPAALQVDSPYSGDCSVQAETAERNLQESVVVGYHGR